MGGKGRPQRPAGIACRGLNPDVLERTVAQHLAVGHAVERHPPGEAQIIHPSFPRQTPRQAQHYFFGHLLD